MLHDDTIFLMKLWKVRHSTINQINIIDQHHHYHAEESDFLDFPLPNE